MRLLTWAGTALVAVALLTACGAESGPTGESVPSLSRSVCGLPCYRM